MHAIEWSRIEDLPREARFLIGARTPAGDFIEALWANYRDEVRAACYALALAGCRTITITDFAEGTTEEFRMPWGSRQRPD